MAGGPYTLGLEFQNHSCVLKEKGQVTWKHSHGFKTWEKLFKGKQRCLISRGVLLSFYVGAKVTAVSDREF